MSLTTLKPILKHAKENGYAVGSFNMLSIETVRGAIRAAEKLNSPIILQFAEVHMSVVPIEYMAPIMLEAAISARVPVCVHFDHGTHYESIEKALELGFNSVMIDAASYPLEENISLTKKVVKLAHSKGATVEAELGQVGGTEGDLHVEAGSLTNADEAVQFVNETGVDALAVSIGNLHGQYKEPPKFNFDVLRKIQEVISIPLVLHGGSGTNVEDFRKVISYGIHKINVATAIHAGASKHVKNRVEKSFKQPGYDELINQMIDGVSEGVEKHIKIFQSDGKANSNVVSRKSSQEGYSEEMIADIVAKVITELY